MHVLPDRTEMNERTQWVVVIVTGVVVVAVIVIVVVMQFCAMFFSV